MTPTEVNCRANNYEFSLFSHQTTFFQIDIVAINDRAMATRKKNLQIDKKTFQLSSTLTFR